MGLPPLLVVERRWMGLPPQSLLVVENLGFWLAPQGGDRPAQFLDFAPETGILQLKVGHPLAQFADQLVAHGARQFSSDREPATVCRPGGRGRERPR
jgi:hypothetical protein